MIRHTLWNMVGQAEQRLNITNFRIAAFVNSYIIQQASEVPNWGAVTHRAGSCTSLSKGHLLKHSTCLK